MRVADGHDDRSIECLSLPKPSIIYIPHLQENRLLSGFSEGGLQSAGADENNFRV
jgi:hypothetical protein